MLILIFSLVCLGLAVSVGLNAGFWAALGVFVGGFLLLSLMAFLFLLYLCSRVDQNVPQEADDPLYRKVLSFVEVVGTHDRPRLALLHSRTESR